MVFTFICLPYGDIIMRRQQKSLKTRVIQNIGWSVSCGLCLDQNMFHLGYVFQKHRSRGV